MRPPHNFLVFISDAPKKKNTKTPKPLQDTVASLSGVPRKS
jgi:hypothetical protein